MKNYYNPWTKEAVGITSNMLEGKERTCPICWKGYVNLRLHVKKSHKRWKEIHDNQKQEGKLRI